MLIYSGKLDYICNYIGGAAWTRNLQWPGQVAFNNAPRNAWNIVLTNGTTYAAGTSQIASNFAWLEVNNAGHMVRARARTLLLSLTPSSSRCPWTSPRRRFR